MLPRHVLLVSLFSPIIRTVRLQSEVHLFILVVTVICCRLPLLLLHLCVELTSLFLLSVHGSLCSLYSGPEVCSERVSE